MATGLTRLSTAWIDIHAHVAGLARVGVDPTLHGVDQGVATLVDAGSAPPGELGERLEHAQSRTKTEILAWANICAEGIAGDGCADHDISGQAARAALASLPGRVVGIKLQASATRLASRGMVALENAKAVASDVNVPLLVHVGNGPPTVREVAAALRPGDIITHFAHGKPEGALDAAGRPHPALSEARARGVLFDVGHGSGSFSFDVMEQLGAHGFWPDIISTDLHARSAASPVGSLAGCMSKLLCLGMPEDAVIAAAGDRPRAALDLPPATLRSRFRIDAQPWAALDSYGNRRTLPRRFIPLGIEEAAS
jgi:dihydroorotase